MTKEGVDCFPTDGRQPEAAALSAPDAVIDFPEIEKFGREWRAGQFCFPFGAVGFRLAGV
jgi:hypothetical protein